MTAQPPADPCTSSFVRPSRASSVTHGIGWVRHSCRGVLPCGIVLLSRGTRHTALTATASRAMPCHAGRGGCAVVPLAVRWSPASFAHRPSRRTRCHLQRSHHDVVFLVADVFRMCVRCPASSPVPCRLPTAKGRDGLHAMSGSHPVKPNGASGRLAVCVRLPVASPASHAGASHGYNDKERGCPSRAAPQCNSIKSEKSFAYFLNLTTLPSTTAI